MWFSEDFDLDRLLEEKKALLVEPQLRFLWQHEEVLTEYLEKASLRFGRKFTWGLEGICFHPARLKLAGWRRLTVKETSCRLDYATEADLCAGLDFFLDQLCAAPDGRMFLPCGIWDFNPEKKEEK